MLKSSKIAYEITGSYRRKKKDSGDIDILVFDEQKTPSILTKFLDHIKNQGIIVWTYSTGNEKISTIVKLPGLKTKVKLDLFRVQPEYKNSFLLYSTGSAKFNRDMRARAKSMGYLLNQYGLFKDKKLVPISSERDVFKKLGMQYVHPENR